MPIGSQQDKEDGDAEILTNIDFMLLLFVCDGVKLNRRLQVLYY